MFRKINKKRHVVLAIKTTGFDKEIDCMTQIACVEMKDGKLTGKTYQTYLRIDDDALREKCEALYLEKLTPADANKLIEGLQAAPQFSDIEKELLEFLSKDNAKVIVHYKKHVLDFLRAAMSEQGLEKLNSLRMENMISKVTKLSKQGDYHAGQYPAEVDGKKPNYKNQQARKRFDDVCSELGVSTRRRTGYDAMQDADMLARAERARLQKFAKKGVTHEQEARQGLMLRK